MTMERLYRYNAVGRCTLLGLALVSFAACAPSRAVRKAEPRMNDDAPAALTGMITDGAEHSPEHQRLGALIGNWKAATRAWRGPGAPAEEGKGTMSNFWMLDGRFVGQEYESRRQRPRHQGLGALGYDNIRKVYTSVWLDTTSTSIYSATGSCDASGKVFTLDGVNQDPVTGKPVRWRSITRMINRKEYTFELFKQIPAGKMFRTLEITYTRE